MTEDNTGSSTEERKKTSVAPFIAAVIIAVIAIVGVVVMGQKAKYLPVGVGTRAFDFNLPDLEGKPTQFSQYAGKVIFLNFWATWCEPCKEEMPSMQNLSSALEGQPFVVVAVSIDSEPAKVVKEFTESYRLTFPILHDRKGLMRDTYKTTGVPETYIIDQNGVIAEKVMGGRDWADKSNLQLVSELLKNGPMKPEEYKDFYKNNAMPTSENYGSQTIY